MAIFDPSQRIAELGREAAQGVQSSIESLSNIVGARLQAGIAQEKYKLSLYDNLVSEIDAKSDELSEVNKEYTSQVIEGQKKRIFDQIQAQIKEGGDITRESIEGLEKGAQEIARAVNISNAITKSYKKNGETLTKLATKGIVTTPALLGTLEEMERKIMDPATYRKDPEEVSREIQRLVAGAVNVPAATMELYKDQAVKEMTYEVGGKDVFISGPQGLMGQDGKLDLQKLKADVRSVMQSIPGSVVTDELVNQYSIIVARNFDTKSSIKTNTARVREERIASEGDKKEDETINKEFITALQQPRGSQGTLQSETQAFKDARELIRTAGNLEDIQPVFTKEQADKLGIDEFEPGKSYLYIEYKESNKAPKLIDLSVPESYWAIEGLVKGLNVSKDVENFNIREEAPTKEYENEYY